MIRKKMFSGISLLIILMLGCTAVPIKPNDDPGTIFNQQIDVVHKAGVDSLVVLGFDIKTTSPNYIEGYRPRRWGFFSGSGGETIGIWVAKVEATSTRVHINTARTSFGISGQKDWNDDIIAEMKRNLK